MNDYQSFCGFREDGTSEELINLTDSDLDVYQLYMMSDGTDGWKLLRLDVISGKAPDMIIAGGYVFLCCSRRSRPLQ